MTDASTAGGAADQPANNRQDPAQILDVEGVTEVVESLLATVEGDLTGRDLKLHGELRRLIDEITAAKAEISGMRPLHLKSEVIPDATGELDAVVAMTEQATSTILGAMEELEAMCELLDQDEADKIREIVTRIYEASAFQDITGQRVTKVINTLMVIEERITSLAAAIGHTADPAEPEEKAKPSDKDLLSGPQLPDQANSQDDIDALLASFD